MNTYRLLRLACIILLCPFASPDAYSQISLPKLISDGMVLQRDTELRIWGWASPGEKVSVRFKRRSFTTKADNEGNWQLMLPKQPAGGPYAMELTGSNQLIIQDILIGDVWLCAGQSNMVHYLELHKDRYAEEISNSDFPEIRQFLVPTNPALTGPVVNLPDGSWKKADPENVLRFSVVAYFFAKALYEKYQVPIGLINSSVGGTPIEAWTSEAGLADFTPYTNKIHRNKDTAFVDSVNLAAALVRQEITKSRPEDIGLTEKWHDPSYDAENWRIINIPGYWEDQGVKNLDGVVWYRKEINIPSAMTGLPARIEMGRIVDADEVYINGQRIGGTGYQYPQRRYHVPDGVLKSGRNLLTIRVTNYSGRGGFVPDKPYYLIAGNDTLDLKGYWKYKVGAVHNDQSFNGGISLQHQPAALFNGMIAPFTRYPIRGALWYQGESNASRPAEYQQLLPALIQDWRNQWDQPDLPFLYVQLPNFMEVNYTPAESQWAQLRQAQLNALDLDRTAMAVAIDLGEWNDIHPGNKKPIGERLALAARHIAYGEEDVVFSGPIYRSAEIQGNEVTLSFDHVGSGLVSGDGEMLRWFALAGEDKIFKWANAQIRGDKVAVWNDEVIDPVYIRYAWADNPDPINFYNNEGLPASPFEAQLRKTTLWYGKKAALVLTYDDALEVHLDHAIPALDALGFKATFYLTSSFPGCKNRLEDWKKVAAKGHELGNHTLFHPCDGSSPERSWITPANDLGQYTTAQIVREIEMTNVFLESLDGQKERTFAYTCGETQTGEGSFVDAIKDQFVAMRGVSSQLNLVETLDLTNLNCFVVDNSNADQLTYWAEQAKKENALLVVLFHGVGGGHSGNIDLNRHNDFLKYLKENKQDFWITTMREASKHYIQHRKK